MCGRRSRRVGIATLVLLWMAGATALSAAEMQQPERGKKYFEDHCASCHHSDGRGVEGEGPTLSGSSWVGESEIRLIKIVLHGMRGPVTVGGKTYNREMPGFGARLSDSEIAALLSFVRRRWGGRTTPVRSKTVSRMRSAFRNRKDYWTAGELLKDP